MSILVSRLFFFTFIAALASPRADAGICVNVAVHFANPPLSAALVSTLEQETTAIWGRYDVELRWQAPACDVVDASFEIRIERHLPRATSAPTVLGATWLQPTNIDRVPVLIDYDATEAVLQSLTIDQLASSVGHSPIGPRELGRALGRVVAHEIGHVLLGLPNHQRQGLMRRSFDPFELVFPTRWQYGLSPPEVARLRHRTRWIIANRNSRGASDEE
jgi:hypothetical protein